MSDTTTSTMKEAERLLRVVRIAVTKVAVFPSGSAQEQVTQASDALLDFIRSLVEAQPCAVPDDYAQRVGQYVTERATQHGWTRDQPEDAFMFMMRRCREVALEDARQPCAVAGEAKSARASYARDITPLEDVDNLARMAWLVGRMSEPDDDTYMPSPGMLEVIGRLNEVLAAPSAVLPLKGEAPTPAHNGHPMRHWDRTCPACIASIDNGAAGEGATYVCNKCGIVSALRHFRPSSNYEMCNYMAVRIAGEGAAAPSVEPTEQVQLTDEQIIERVVQDGLWLARCYDGNKPVLNGVGAAVIATVRHFLAARPTPAAGVPPELKAVMDFLDGAAPLEGLWFGEKLEGESRYWWRSKLRAAIKSAFAASPGGVPTGPSDFMVALAFHEAYERLAPSFGYTTRPETRAFDSNSPNGKLMIAVIGEMRAALSAGAPSSLRGERK